jgi:hypothetical protein
MIAKPRPRLLEKKDRRAAIAATDKAENTKVKARSGGQCEVIEAGTNAIFQKVTRRCPLRASHVHHLISGIGRRNVGKSIEAAHKIHVCEKCHELIHGHVLKPINATEREAAATVRYERVL